MASDPYARRALVATFIAVPTLVLMPLHAGAAAWWSPVALRGTALAAVDADGATVEVRTASGTTLRSTDSGVRFSALPGNPPLAAAPASAAGITWTIDARGQVRANGHPDDGAPDLGAGARLIAAPGALPGVVVAVATDGTVWRRAAAGGWQRALLLLPQSMVQGVPRVTSVSAFARPLSGTVYLGTDGYSVLNSTDGGDDWIRAGPGLPDGVFGIATDDAAKSIYAATADGLWVHTLQALPAPPAYRDAALVWRWVGIVLVTLVASLLTVLGLARVLRPSP